MPSSRRVINHPGTGVYPPFDSDFARAVRQNLDSISDQDLANRIDEYAGSENLSIRQSRVKLLLEQKRRREERLLKNQLRFLENYSCNLKQIGQISEAEATEITKQWLERYPKMREVLSEKT